jgi:2,5-furandicarboxylate decarboxylase 1
MVQNERQATVSVDPGHDLGKVIAWGGREERPVEFAIVIGAHPALSIASQAKVPMTRDTYHVMGALLGEPVDVVACDTVDLQVPANAEIVLEGRILPGETAAEGPFGEFHYYYGSDPRAALCDITAISHRSDAIFADIHPTHRDHRCLWLHPGREASLLQRLRAAIPSVEAVHLPLEGAGMVALISIDKRHNGDSTRALLIALSFDLFIKHAVILDRDIDIYDAGQVVWAMAVRLRPDRDLVVIPRVRGYHEDPSSYSLGSSDEGGRLTTKLGYDATVPIGGHFPERADSLPSRYAGLDPLEYVDNPVPDALD